MTVSEIFEIWQRPSHIMLHAGEMKAEELRCVRAVVKAVQAEVTAALSDQVVGWQPIETAPRDGTRILAMGGGLWNDVDIVNYNERVGCWDAPNDTLDDTDDEPQGYSRPTLWLPLPPVPVPASTPVRSS